MSGEERLEVGLVKWYGGYNKSKGHKIKFGFIERNNPPEELFVHENNLKTDPENLNEGTIVIYERRFNEKKGKAEAFNVRIPDLTNDADLWFCLNSEEDKVWQEAFNELLENLVDVDETMAYFIAEKLEAINLFDAKEMVKKLPYQALCEYEELRRYLNTEEQIELFSNIYHKEKSQHMLDELVSSIKELIKEYTDATNYSWARYDQELWDAIPKDILTAADIWNVVPDIKKYEILIEKINEAKIIWDNEEEYRVFLKLYETVKQGGSHDTLPEVLKRHPLIFKVLHDVEQVNVAWPNLSSYWRSMKRNAKVLSIFKAAKENELALIKIKATEESDLIIKALLQLVENPTDEHSFLTFHQYITEYVSNAAWETTEPLHLGSLLPTCTVKMANVKYCEARRWWNKDKEEWLKGANGNELVYCPRTKNTCLTTVSGTEAERAHIHPVLEKRWETWSLVEFFKALRVEPELVLSDQLNENDKYVSKLAAWVNRLNDIRKRMKCVKCVNTLVPKTTYSKDFAAYNSTVASCPEFHDEGIYLNHCWNCQKIVDSRECKVKQNGYYLCIHCGCGPKFDYSDREARTLHQGALCPKCGESNMEVASHDNEVKECRNKKCQHRIHFNGEISYHFSAPMFS